MDGSFLSYIFISSELSLNEVEKYEFYLSYLKIISSSISSKFR